MNILYICNTDPRQNSFGSEQRSHYLYDALAKIGTVYTLSETVREESADAKIRPLSLLPRHGFVPRFINAVAIRIVRRFFPNMPLRYLPCHLELQIGRVYPGVKFDIVVMRYMKLAGWIHPWRIAPTFIDIDDHPLQVYDTIQAPKMGRVRRAISRFGVKLLCWWIMRHLEGVWLANPEQKRMAAAKRVVCLYNLPPEFSSNYNPECARMPMLMTVGLMRYAPNYNGVDDFVQTIWPSVKKVYPDLEYWIIGRDAPEEMVDRWQEINGVKYLGFVEDLDAVYEKALATVVPIAQGGGTCIKTLESMSRSRICMSTSFGARGIPSEDLEGGVNGLFLFGDASSFIAVLDRIMKDQTFRTEKEAAARSYIAAHYSLNKFYSSVRCLLDDVAV